MGLKLTMMVVAVALLDSSRTMLAKWIVRNVHQAQLVNLDGEVVFNVQQAHMLLQTREFVQTVKLGAFNLCQIRFLATLAPLEHFNRNRNKRVVNLAPWEPTNRKLVRQVVFHVQPGAFNP